MKRDPFLQEEPLLRYGHCLFQHVSEGILQLDPNGVIQYANPVAHRLFGREELRGLSVSRLFSMVGSSSVTSHSKGGPLPYRKPDGTSVWLQWRRIPYPESGPPEGFFLTVQDVTASIQVAQAEKDLERSDRQCAQAARLARLGYWEWDLSRNRIQWSEEVSRMFSIPHQRERTLKECLQLVHPDDRERVYRRVQFALNGGSWEMEFRLLHPEGGSRHIRQTGELSCDADGFPVLASGTIQDITSQKAAEEALQLSETKFCSVLQSAKDGIIMADYHGRILSWNRGAKEIFGYTEEEALGQPISVIFPTVIHSDYQKELRRHQQDARMIYPSRTVEMMGLRKDGTEVPAEISFTSWEREENRIFVGIIRDIRERKKTEELLRQSEKLMVVGQLAAGVAHEIRNPLTALRGFVQLLFREEDYRGVMLSELDRIEWICREFLLLAKPQPVQFVDKNPVDILEDVRMLLQSQALLNRVVIITEIDEPLPTITCEANLLKQAFTNLLKNGMEAMPEGGTLYVRLTSEPDGIRLTVTDEGDGIPREDLPRLGEPFFTTKEEGTGLGLMITRQIIHHHKGTLSFSSEIGKGTSVTLRLPVKPDTDEQE
ncbi:PAS domain S-box protein [Salinithrix halophila]|uniref:histidine kinase n=1 Tax=Salinithrix halophila TaxID=1485204 RepID=A0ABV8JB85_9BACL